MSFATDLKDELCKDVPEQESAVHALLYGFLLFSHKFHSMTKVRTKRHGLL